jgi:peptidoglycan/xylan/chitin deacetylase (PgdA/CDA1 family)
MNSTETLTQFSARTPLSLCLRAAARDAALRVLSWNRRIDSSNNWIRFPFYHHVFEDERAGFHRQLTYLCNFGEFISLDDALTMFDAGTKIDGRYFCITFDDGLKSCHWGAAPILNELSVPAVFYVITDMIGRRLEPDSDDARVTFGFQGRDTTLDFLDWEELRQLADSGFAIGSHTSGHAKLATLETAEARIEMQKSKSELEAALLRPCKHFCPPYGIPGLHFLPARDGGLAREVGYRSLVSGQRGPNGAGTDPFFIKRDHLLANWGLHQVRYFMSLD